MGILLAALLAASAPQENQSKLVWKWRPGNTNCVLRQDAGDGRFLDIGTKPSSNEIGLRIVDTRARTRTSKPIKEVELSFSLGATVKRDGYIEPNKDPFGRTTYVFLTADDLVPLAGATNVKVSHADVGTLSLPIQSPSAALASIKACDELRMKEWGIDPVAWRNLTVKPTPATQAVKWFSWTDYPDREKIYRDDIEVVARLDVAADGSVLKCTVVNLPPKEFIPAACNALMRNAKFNPARDAQGQPIPAPYIFQVVFAAYYI